MFRKLQARIRLRLSQAGRYPELRRFSLFKELGDHDLSLIHDCLHSREFKSGEILFEEDFPTEVIYFIVEGEVQVSGLCHGSGNWVLKKHQFLGIIDIFGTGKRLSTATALTDLKTLALPESDFWELVMVNPALGVRLLKACGRFLAGYIVESTQRNKTL